jgi:hypothetical protein
MTNLQQNTAHTTTTTSDDTMSETASEVTPHTIDVPMQQGVIPESTPKRSATHVTPDVSSLNGKGYKELASDLPSPSQLITDTSDPRPQPPAADAYTIPGNHVDASALPFNRKELPWRSWRSKYTTIESLYMLAARHYADEQSNRRAIHAVFSPSPDAITTVDDVAALKQEAIEVAMNNGIRGGVTAFHGFRVKSQVSQQFNELLTGSELEETATGVLLWEWIRQGTLESYLTWGPHIHIIGLCRKDEETVDSYRGDGVFKRLRVFKPYTRDMPMEAIADHRSVGKDTVDHLTFHPERNEPPMHWFGNLRDNSPVIAKQYATDHTVNELRERLINGPTNPEFYDADVQTSETTHHQPQLAD